VAVRFTIYGLNYCCYCNDPCLSVCLSVWQAVCLSRGGLPSKAAAMCKWVYVIAPCQAISQISRAHIRKHYSHCFANSSRPLLYTVSIYGISLGLGAAADKHGWLNTEQQRSCVLTTRALHSACCFVALNQCLRFIPAESRSCPITSRPPPASLQARYWSVRTESDGGALLLLLLSLVVVGWMNCHIHDHDAHFTDRHHRRVCVYHSLMLSSESTLSIYLSICLSVSEINLQ